MRVRLNYWAAATPFEDSGRERVQVTLKQPNEAHKQLRVFVTGGAGFVGSTLVSDLLAEGHTVAIYDNFSVGRPPLPADRLTVIDGDIRDEARLHAALRDEAPAAVIHLAALHYIPYCDAHPVDTMHVNVVGTQALLEACAKAGVERFVFASSAAVYGISSAPHREDQTPDPQDIYGLSKSVGEQQVAAFHRRTGIPCTIARLFNVFGRGETNPHLVPEILRQIRESGDTLSLGNLTPRRDYVHVTDVSRALRMFVNGTDDAIRTYNVGTAHAVSVRDIISALESILERRLTVAQAPNKVRRIDRPNLQADITRLSADYGWTPLTSLIAGLRDLTEGLAPASPAKGSLAP